jgi:hypothetical protein
MACCRTKRRAASSPISSPATRLSSTTETAPGTAPARRGNRHGRRSDLSRRHAPAARRPRDAAHRRSPGAGHVAQRIQRRRPRLHRPLRHGFRGDCRRPRPAGVLVQGRSARVHPRARRAHAGHSGLRRQRHVPELGQCARESARRPAVPGFRATAAIARERHRHGPRRRSAARQFPGRSLHRARDREADLPRTARVICTECNWSSTRPMRRERTTRRRIRHGSTTRSFATHCRRATATTADERFGRVPPTRPAGGTRPRPFNRRGRRRRMRHGRHVRRMR